MSKKKLTNASAELEVLQELKRSIKKLIKRLGK